MRISFTKSEIEALASAGEEMIQMVSEGKRWQNEPPETLSALRSATKKLLRHLVNDEEGARP